MNFSRPNHKNIIMTELWQKYTKLIFEWKPTWSKAGRNILIFYLFFIIWGFVEQLLTNTKVCVADFHRQVSR